MDVQLVHGSDVIQYAPEFFLAFSANPEME